MLDRAFGPPRGGAAQPGCVLNRAPKGSGWLELPRCAEATHPLSIARVPQCYKNVMDTDDDDLADADAGDVGQTVGEIRKSLDSCLAQISQLERALETRDIIGQAKGVLMARQRITADTAFELLVRASQRTNIKVRDVAAELVVRVHAESFPESPAQSE